MGGWPAAADRMEIRQRLMCRSGGATEVHRVAPFACSKSRAAELRTRTSAARRGGSIVLKKRLSAALSRRSRRANSGQVSGMFWVDSSGRMARTSGRAPSPVDRSESRNPATTLVIMGERLVDARFLARPRHIPLVEFGDRDALPSLVSGRLQLLAFILRPFSDDAQGFLAGGGPVIFDGRVYERREETTRKRPKSTDRRVVSFVTTRAKR